MLRQPGLPAQADGGRLDLFGKRFGLRPVEDAWRIVVHEDYPLIGADDAEAFARFALDRGCLSFSARLVPVQAHPYRLLRQDPDGRERHVHAAPPDVRGDRHRYPEVWEIVPALVAIPPGRSVLRDLDLGLVALCGLFGPRLLDRTLLLDRIRLAALAAAISSAA
jgi:hypothetical protein